MFDAISNRVAREIASGSGVAAFAEWSKMTPEEWATEAYRLPTGGRFSFDYAPYSREMFRSIWEPHRIETVFRLYSRGLKSTVILISMGYIMDQSARDILSLWPTNNNAELFSKENLTIELLDCVPRLHWLGSKAKKRIRDNTLLHKRFHGGKISIIGANAPGDLRRAKGRFLAADEIDAMQETETDEGDILKIFDKRGDEFPDAIRTYASYPSIKGHSRIDKRLEDTDYCQWRVTCVLCGGEPFMMHRDQLRYEPDKTQEARLECPKCKGLLTDNQRYAMAHGQGFDNWIPSREYRGRKGFHGNSMLWPHPIDRIKYPGGYLQILAEREIADEKSENPSKSRRVTKNTEDAESYDPDTQTEIPPDAQKLFNRRESYATDKKIVIPAGGLVLTAFTDVQGERLETTWTAWGKDEEAWVVDHMVLQGYTQEMHVWKELEKQLKRTFAHEHGPELSLSWGFIDSGFSAEMVLRFLGHLRTSASPILGKVRASRGSSQCPHPIVSLKYGTLARQLKGHWIGTNEAKDNLYARLRMDVHEDDRRRPCPRYVHFGENLSGSYFQQLTVEKVTVEWKGGQELRLYKNEQEARNEALDCLVGCYAAFKMRRWNFDAIEAELMAKPVEEETPVPVPAPTPQINRFTGGKRWTI
jgi:phage terminase large subunit GpA-like protein